MKEELGSVKLDSSDDCYYVEIGGSKFYLVEEKVLGRVYELSLLGSGGTTPLTCLELIANNVRAFIGKV